MSLTKLLDQVASRNHTTIERYRSRKISLMYCKARSLQHLSDQTIANHTIEEQLYLAIELLEMGKLHMCWKLLHSPWFLHLDSFDWLYLFKALLLYQYKHHRKVQGYQGKRNQYHREVFQAFWMVVTSPCLQQKYSQILALGDSATNVEDLALRCMIVYVASGIPHGVENLVKLWKKHHYNVSLVWNFAIDRDFERDVEAFDNSFYGPESEISNNGNILSNPFLQVCRYGHPRDLNFFWSHTELWVPDTRRARDDYSIDCSCNTTKSPLGQAILNNNFKTFTKFLELHRVLKLGLMEKFGSLQIVTKIWSQCFYDKFYNKKEAILAIGAVLHFTVSNPNTHWQRRINLLVQRFQLYPDESTFKDIDLENARIVKQKFTESIVGSWRPDTVGDDHRLQLANKYLYMPTGYSLDTVKFPNSYFYWCPQVPTHPQSHELLMLRKNPTMVYTPKADGVTFEGILPPGVYPRSPYQQVKAEVIQLSDGRTLYLVFDGRVTKSTTEGTLSKIPILERMQAIHNSWKTNQYGYSKTQYPYLSLGQENEALLRFLNLNITKSVIWWPKGLYETTVDEFSQFMYLLDRPPITPHYPNDGWIIYAPSGDLFKVKPYEHLTADLDLSKPAPGFMPDTVCLAYLFGEPEPESEPEIWRCVWDKETESWVPREERPEKKTPNSDEIVSQMVAQHKNPWWPGQLAAFNSKTFYYAHVVNSRNTRKTDHIRKMINDLKAFREVFITQSSPQIVNVGCGYNANYSYQTISLEIDPFVVFDFHLKDKYNSKGQYHWADGVTFCHPITKEPVEIPENYKIITMWNSLHYMARSKEAFEQFLTHLDHFQHFYMSIIDGDRVGDHVEFSDGSYLSKTKDGWDPNMVWIEHLLKWQTLDMTPVPEPMISETFLTKHLEANGWKLKKSVSKEMCITFLYFEKKASSGA